MNQSQEKHRRIEIMEAALKRFFQTGIRKTTLEQIANDVGLVKSAIYKYFANKEDLFNQTIDMQGVKVLHEMRSESLKYQSAAEKIMTAMQMQFDFFMEKTLEDGLTGEVWHEIRPLLISNGMKHRDDMLGFLSELIEAGNRAGEFVVKAPEVVADILFSGIFNVHESVLFNFTSIEQAKERKDVFIETMLKGMKKD